MTEQQQAMPPLFKIEPTGVQHLLYHNNWCKHTSSFHAGLLRLCAAHTVNNTLSSALNQSSAKQPTTFLVTTVYKWTVEYESPSNLSPQLFVFHSFSPSFSKLEEWLENLLMHLEIGLPLLSELEQLRRAFWQNQERQNHFHTEDNSLDSQEQTHCSEPQRHRADTKQRSDSDNNHVEPHHLTKSRDQNSKPDCHDMRTERDHLSKECNDHSKDKSRTICRSESADSDKNGSETYEHNNPSGQPQTQQEVSQPLQVNDSLVGRPNRIRRTCRVLWDSNTENSSFLWLLNSVSKIGQIYRVQLKQ